jgi:tetratricopeptide (TPR) repeat protein
MSEQQPGPASAQSLAQAQAEAANGNTVAAGSLVRQAVGRADTSPAQLAQAARLAADLGMEEAFGWFMRSGRLLLDSGDTDQARKAFEAAKALDEKNYEPIFELGRVEIAAGNKAAGLGRFAEVLRKSAYTFVPALFEAGCVYEADDQIDQAILTFKRIVERDKSHAEALAHLGRLYRIKQMAPEATAYLLQSAEAARKVMDYALALQCARDILEFDPGNARARGLESEMERIAPEPRDRPKPVPKAEPKPAPPPPPVEQIAAAVMPPDYKLIEQQSKATLELAQVTAAIAESYKQRLAIEEQIKAAQTTLESVAALKAGADQELTAIKAQLDNVAKARAAEEATLVALSTKLEQARTGLVSIEALHENVKQADDQRASIVTSMEQLQTEAGGVRTRADKAKTDAVAVEKALLEVAASFGALKKEAEAAKTLLDEAKTRAERAKADAIAAEATVAKSRETFDQAKTQVEGAERRIIEAAAHAHAVAGDSTAALAGIADVEATITTTMAAQKGIQDAVGQLRALAVALTERRKQTEATLAQIQGLGESQAAGLSDVDIAKLEAGLAAAIERASTPAPAAPVKPNGSAPAPDVAAKQAKTDTEKAEAQKAETAKVEAAKVSAQKAEHAKVEAVKADAAKADAAKADAAKAVSAKADAVKADAAKAETAKAETARAEAAKAEAAKAEAAKAADKPAAPKADDDSPGGIYARGVAQLEGGKPQEALKTLEQLQSNSEFAVLVETAIGRCYAQMDDHDEALARYAKALEVSGHPEEQYHDALYYMAAAHESRDDSESHELATWALEEIYAANPKYRDVAARLDSLKAKAAKAAAGGAA